MARNRVWVKHFLTLRFPSSAASYRERGLNLRWLIAKRVKHSVEAHSVSWGVLSLIGWTGFLFLVALHGNCGIWLDKGPEEPHSASVGKAKPWGNQWQHLWTPSAIRQSFQFGTRRTLEASHKGPISTFLAIWNNPLAHSAYSAREDEHLSYDTHVISQAT